MNIHQEKFDLFEKTAKDIFPRFDLFEGLRYAVIDAGFGIFSDKKNIMSMKYVGGVAAIGYLFFNLYTVPHELAHVSAALATGNELERIVVGLPGAEYISEFFPKGEAGDFTGSINVHLKHDASFLEYLSISYAPYLGTPLFSLAMQQGVRKAKKGLAFFGGLGISVSVLGQLMGDFRYMGQRIFFEGVEYINGIVNSGVEIDWTDRFAASALLSTGIVGGIAIASKTYSWSRNIAKKCDAYLEQKGF